jgi:hypothetical protein
MLNVLIVHTVPAPLKQVELSASFPFDFQPIPLQRLPGISILKAITGRLGLATGTMHTSKAAFDLLLCHGCSQPQPIQTIFRT